MGFFEGSAKRFHTTCPLFLFLHVGEKFSQNEQFMYLYDVVFSSDSKPTPEHHWAYLDQVFG